MSIHPSGLISRYCETNEARVINCSTNRRNMDKQIIKLQDIADLLSGHIIYLGQTEIELDNFEIKLLIEGDGYGGPDKHRLMEYIKDRM